ALQHAVGQALTFVRQRADGRSDTVRATVVRVNPPQYRLTDGRFVLSEPGEPLFPAALVGPVPEAAVVLEAARARPHTELAYVAQGASWQVVYQMILTGARCQVSGTATITSQSLAADSAEVQLVAGAIGRCLQAPCSFIRRTPRAGYSSWGRHGATTPRRGATCGCSRGRRST